MEGTENFVFVGSWKELLDDPRRVDGQRRIVCDRNLDFDDKNVRAKRNLGSFRKTAKGTKWEMSLCLKIPRGGGSMSRRRPWMFATSIAG